MSFLWVKRLTSSSFSYCLVLEFAHKSGYGVIMHFYKLFRVLTLFSENCSYNTLRFIFIILLPVKAAWSHDDDDDETRYNRIIFTVDSETHHGVLGVHVPVFIACHVRVVRTTANQRPPQAVCIS